MQNLLNRIADISRPFKPACLIHQQCGQFTIGIGPASDTLQHVDHCIGCERGQDGPTDPFVFRILKQNPSQKFSGLFRRNTAQCAGELQTDSDIRIGGPFFQNGRKLFFRNGNVFQQGNGPATHAGIRVAQSSQQTGN